MGVIIDLFLEVLDFIVTLFSRRKKRRKEAENMDLLKRRRTLEKDCDGS